MDDETSTDHGTVLPGKAAALVAMPDGDIQLLIPQMPDDADVPESVLLLTALMIRIESDSGFAQEQIDWLQSRDAG